MKAKLSKNQFWVLICVLFVCAIGALALNSSALINAAAGWRYRKYRDASSLQQVLRNLRDGDTIQEVENVLGPGKPNNSSEYRAICAKVMASDPVGAPAGYQSTDELLGFSAKGPRATIHLQFRNGRLINHNPLAQPFISSALK